MGSQYLLDFVFNFNGKLEKVNRLTDVLEFL